MNSRTATLQDDLVACNGCGLVFEKTRAADHVRCPVCETTGERKPVVRLGHVNKWWTEVDS